MSGPKTSHYNLRAQRRQEQERRQAEEKKRREELAARTAAARAVCSDLEKRTARLTASVREIQESFPAEKLKISAPCFEAPQTDDPKVLEKYAAKIEKELAKAESALQKAGEQAKANQAFRGAAQSAAKLCSGDTMSADEVMRRFSETATTNLTEKQLLERRAELDRVLGRHAAAGWEASPPKLEHLVMEALSTRSDTRYDALATELRHQIQLMNQEQAHAQANAKKAQTLLDRLELDAPSGADKLKQRLELVKVGALALPDDMEAQVAKAVAEAEHARARESQEAASGIVREALLDLGYEVAPIEETLFVRGGKVYFRKPGWNDYCVRLTVRPEENKINFNVIRVAGPDEDKRAAAGAADIEAENAWCSGYQQVVDTFKARGLETELTRHLPVGAVPVPVVGADEVPAAAFGAPAKKRKPVRKSKVLGGDAR